MIKLKSLTLIAAVLFAQGAFGATITKKDSGSADPFPVETCAAIEVLLQRNANNIPEASDDQGDHITRAKIFDTLAHQACDENREKYKIQVVKEIDLAMALADSWNGYFGANEFIQIYKIYNGLELSTEKLRQFIQLRVPEYERADLLQKIQDGLK